jgi:hypothetical protein
MKDLFLSEIRRFKNAALIAAGVHLLLLFAANRFLELLQREYQIHIMILVIYLIGALAFALYQFGSYRQPSRWMWLMHRPMSPASIFAATSLASAALITFAIGLPVLLAILGTDLLTTRVVDSRHYLLVPHVLVLTMCAWLTGTYVILNQRRSAIVLLYLPILMLLHLASGWVMLLPAALCLALLVFIVRGIFKPNRVAPPAHGSAIAATALPLQLGFYFMLIWAGSLTYQYGQMLLGVHPLNTHAPPAGGFAENTRADGKDVFLRGLAQSSDARAPQWRRQLPLLKIGNFEAEIYQYPVRHQISNAGLQSQLDPTGKSEWTFSHDAMRYQLRDMITGEPQGWIGQAGLGDEGKFATMPLYIVRTSAYLMSAQHLSIFDHQTAKFRQLVQFTAPETLARTPITEGKLQYILTNERLIAYAIPAEDAKGPLEEKFSVALPGAFSDLDRVDVADLLDGTLVSLSFGRNMVNGAETVPQTIYHVDAGGRAAVVAQRALRHDFPVLFNHHDWWVSPVLHAVMALPDVLLDKGIVLDKGRSAKSNALTRTRPAQAWIAALVAAAMSAALAWLWLRRIPLQPARRIGWIASCLLLGPASLLCLMLLQPRPPKELPHSKAALAAA